MNRNKLPQKQIKLAGVISLLLLTFASYSPQVYARLAQSFSKVANTQHHLAQKFPDNGQPKGRRRGGTSRRDGCPKLKTPITALVPGEENNHKSFLKAILLKFTIYVWL